MNASPITKITSWLEFLGKNLHLMSCATFCAKSEVMLTYIYWRPYLHCIFVESTFLRDSLTLKLPFGGFFVCILSLVCPKLFFYNQTKDQTYTLSHMFTQFCPYVLEGGNEGGREATPTSISIHIWFLWYKGLVIWIW